MQPAEGSSFAPEVLPTLYPCTASIVYQLSVAYAPRGKEYYHFSPSPEEYLVVVFTRDAQTAQS